MTNLLVTDRSAAYMNWGKWVADCTRNCGYAVSLKEGQTSFVCDLSSGGCGHINPVAWPSNAVEIWDILLERPMMKTRNWFPSNHSLAVRAGCPHGQTVQELREEAHKNGAL